MLCLVGNAPSSGSTLLADLLDSSDFSACGPELEFFCNKYIYHFDKFKKNIDQTSHLVSLRSTGIFPKYDKLPLYGMNQSILTEMINQSSELSEFFDRFARHFLNFRTKDTNGIVFEKTPQNLNCIGEYLNSYPQGFFLVIVRNPIFVYHSLLNRNWGNYTAFCTWLIAAAQVIQYADHEKLIIIKYEDLVKDPFKEIAYVFQKIMGVKVDRNIIKINYEKNIYREKYSKMLNGWQVKEKKKIINANDKLIPPAIKSEFSKVFNLKISKDYADHYQIPDISFKEALKFFGYEKEVLARPAGGRNLLNDIKFQTRLPRFSWQDYRKLSAKWFRELKTGYSNLPDFKKFFRVVEPVEIID